MKLEGIKVLDLSMFLPGPHLTMMMADHGAEVIRIEPPAGEPTRSLGASQNGMTVWFRNTHRSKQSVVLDLKQPAAVEAFMRLAATADVVVEAFRPGVVDRLGIGPKAVRAVNPRVVYCSISAFGQTGPLAQRPAHDLSIAAESGIVALNRGHDGEPGILGMPAVDMASSLMALSGILMALLRREKTGQGDTLDISMQDSIVSWTINNVSPVFAEGRELDTTTERTLGGTAFYNVYRCADGRSITLGGSELKFCENVLERARPARPARALQAAARPRPGPRARLPRRDLPHPPARRVGALLRRHRLLLGARQGPCRSDAERPPRGARDARRVSRRADAPRHPDQVRRRARRDPAGRARPRRAFAQRARQRRIPRDRAGLDGALGAIR